MTKRFVRKKKEQPIYSVPALDKSLDILETLAAASVPQTLVELARTLKRTPSEIFRMLDALERRSYIAREPVSGGYQLTLKLYELAHTHSPVEQLVKASALPMRTLANDIHELCYLCVFSGSFLTVVAQAASPEPVRLSIEAGYRVLLPPLSTVSGKLLVAYLQPKEQEQYLEADPAYAGAPESERDAIRAELKAIRRAGFYMAPSKKLRTVTDVSSYVGNPAVGVSAALCVPFIAGHINDGKERKLVPRIRDCSDQITKALGLSSER